VLVAGKLVSTSLVGIYGMALALATVPSDLFATTIYPVLLPAFSAKQNDKEALCNAVVRIARYVAIFSLPAMVLAMTSSSTILSIVYGADYSIVAVPFSLLCIYTVLLIQGCIFTSLFYGIGKPGTNRAFVALRCLILAMVMYPSIRFWGFTGAAVAILLANCAAMGLQLVLMRATIGLSISKYVYSWLPGLVLAIPVLAIAMVARSLLPDYPMICLAIGAMSCIVVFLTGLVLLRRFDRSGRQLQLDEAAVGFAGSEEMPKTVQDRSYWRVVRYRQYGCQCTCGICDQVYSPSMA
jgi:O-antigen/teichoic acid export membrane protein